MITTWEKVLPVHENFCLVKLVGKRRDAAVVLLGVWHAKLSAATTAAGGAGPGPNGWPTKCSCKTASLS